MNLRICLSLIAVVFLSGCVTTQSPTELNNLQIKVSQLERTVDERNQEVSDLKYEVEDLKKQVESQDDSRAVATIQEVNASPDASSSSVSSDNGEIIRVAVNPEDVQKALKAAGYYNGAIDGKVGGKTKQAIADFQKAHNLTSDGVVGKRTWTELQKFLN